MNFASRRVLLHNHILQGVEAAVAVMRPLCVRARGEDYMLEVSSTTTSWQLSECLVMWL